MHRFAYTKPLTLSFLLWAACSQVKDAGPPGPVGAGPASRPFGSSGQTVSGTYQGHNWDLYVPGGYQKGTAIPLVLMLHGCLQTPADFEAASDMEPIAEANTFFALFPQEPSSDN